jgi:hypothetical protein
MHRTTYVALAVLALLLIGYAQSSKTASAGESENARYQLFTGVTDAPNQVYHDTFLIDTQTGKVWLYIPSMEGKSGNSTVPSPAGFASLPRWEGPKETVITK